jgi:hypothetical protein
MDEALRKHWPLLVGVPIALIVNAISPGIGIPGVLALSVLWVIGIVFLFLLPRIRRYFSERTRQGRRAKIFRLIGEIDFVTDLYRNSNRLTAYIADALWVFIRITFYWIVVGSICAAVISFFGRFFGIEGPFDTSAANAATYTLIGSCALYVYTIVYAQAKVFRNLWRYDQFLRETTDKIREISCIDNEWYLYIHEATYGFDTSWMDITKLLRSKIRDDQLKWVVGEDVGYDPSPGDRKKAIIHWSFDYLDHHEQSFDEGTTALIHEIPF